MGKKGRNSPSHGKIDPNKDREDWVLQSKKAGDGNGVSRVPSAPPGTLSDEFEAEFGAFLPKQAAKPSSELLAASVMSGKGQNPRKSRQPKSLKKMQVGGARVASSAATDTSKKKAFPAANPSELEEEEFADNSRNVLSETDDGAFDDFPALPRPAPPPPTVTAPTSTGAFKNAMHSKQVLNSVAAAATVGTNGPAAAHVGTRSSAPKAMAAAHVGTRSSAPKAMAPLPPAHDSEKTQPGASNDKPNAWASKSKKIFMNQGIGGKLAFTKPISKRVSIKCSEALPRQTVWGWSLLGQYVGYHPSNYMINDMMKSWGVRARYRVEEGWMIFKFESEEDCDKVLKEGPYFIHGKPLLLKHIPDKFAFNRKDIASIPLWVRIYGLPMDYWTEEVLGRIASHVGKPLFMDPVTTDRKRGAYARVLVEINFATLITREVVLDFDDGESLECKFLLENEPLYCKDCCSFGHDELTCSFKEKRDAVGVRAKKSLVAPLSDEPRGESGKGVGVQAGLVEPSLDAPLDLATSLSGKNDGKSLDESGAHLGTNERETHDKDPSLPYLDENNDSEVGESENATNSHVESGSDSLDHDSVGKSSSEDEDVASSEKDFGDLAVTMDGNVGPWDKANFVDVVKSTKGKKKGQVEPSPPVLGLRAHPKWPSNEKRQTRSTRALHEIDKDKGKKLLV